jgi:hypothetical protein
MFSGVRACFGSIAVTIAAIYRRCSGSIGAFDLIAGVGITRFSGPSLEE